MLSSVKQSLSKTQKKVDETASIAAHLKDRIHSIEGSIASHATSEQVVDLRTDIHRELSSLSDTHTTSLRYVEDKLVLIQEGQTQGRNDVMSQLQALPNEISVASNVKFDELITGKITSEVSASAMSLTSIMNTTSASLADSSARMEQFMSSFSASIKAVEAVLNNSLKDLNSVISSFNSALTDNMIKTISTGSDFIETCKSTMQSLNQEARTLSFDYGKISDMRDILESHEQAISKLNRAVVSNLVEIQRALDKHLASINKNVASEERYREKDATLDVVRTAFDAAHKISQSLVNVKQLSSKEYV